MQLKCPSISFEILIRILKRFSLLKHHLFRVKCAMDFFRILPIFFTVLFSLTGAICPSYTYAEDPITQTELESRRYDYKQMFEFVRDFLTGERGQRLQKEFFPIAFADELVISEELQKEFGFPERFKELSVQQFLIILQSHPEKWDELRTILKQIPTNFDSENLEALELSKLAMKRMHEFIESEAVQKLFSKLNNPSVPFLLDPGPGKIGYRDLQFYANHSRRGLNGKHYRKHNLVKKLTRLLDKKSVKQIVGNTYELDLPEITDVLIKAHKNGKEVYWGVDKSVHSEKSKAAIQRLKEAGFEIVDQKAEAELSFLEQQVLREKRKGKNAIYLVNSTGLNHQKMISINWDYEASARVIFSSGNFTLSGLHPLGDLGDTPFSDPRAIPNANHIATMRSHALAQLVRHQSIMMFDLGLRGRELPFSGAFAVHGAPRKDGTRPKLEISFAPAGGLGNIGKHIIGRSIRESIGPIGMPQFNFSSRSIEAELLQYAIKEKEAGREFVYWGIGDTSSAMRDWSRYLSMGMLKLIKTKEEKYYTEDLESPWRNVLSNKEILRQQARIRMAPDRYIFKDYITTPDGVERKISGKLHHKAAVFGGAKIISEEEARGRSHYLAPDGLRYIPAPGGQAILADSFNFSDSAETNNEQILRFLNEPKATNFAWSILWGLVEDSTRNVVQEANRKNEIFNRLDKLISFDNPFRSSTVKSCKEI